MEKENMENMENMEKVKKADFLYANDNMKNLNWGQGIRYYTCDGHQVATLEQVMQYNEAYYQNYKIKEQKYEENPQLHR